MIAVDAGNTNIKVLVFNANGLVVSQKKWSSDEEASCIAWLEQQNEPVWIADTAGRSWSIGTQVSAQSPWSFTRSYTDEVGVDRLAAMEGARRHFGPEDLLMVSLGTCLTFSYATSSGVFSGGAIAPGWSARLRAMRDYTGSLPLLGTPSDRLAELLATDPRTSARDQSMQRGALQGIVDQIEAEVARFEALSEKLTVVFHGGDALALAGLLKKGIFADANWVALGLWSLAQKK